MSDQQPKTENVPVVSAKNRSESILEKNRLIWAVLGSVVAHLVGLTLAATVTFTRPLPVSSLPETIEMRLPDPPHPASPTPSPTATPTPRPVPTVTPTPTVRPSPIVPPTPVPRPTPVSRPTLQPTPRSVQRPVPRVAVTPAAITPRAPAARPVPEGGRTRVITAPAGAQVPTASVVLPGGNIPAGVPISRQGTGTARSAPVGVAVPAAPVASPEPATPAPAPPATPAPAPATPAPTPPPPTPTPTPRPSGPTREAEPVQQVRPSIPESLKSAQYKSFVRVRVEVGADGSANTVLRTSSGSPEIDQRVLEALKRWKWKPALKNGTAVDSVQLFKFEFEVQ